MRRVLVLAATLAVVLVTSSAALPDRKKSDPAAQVKRIRSLSFEFVGQFQNSAPGVTPNTHVHYGYLSYIRGVSVFKHTPENETTALFTFFAEATTLRVIPDGPLRVITRIGKLTIYRDPSGNGDFARPETFRDGTPVLVAQFRQQVVNNTVTNTFTTFHQASVISTRSFPAGRAKVRLGRIGEAFRIAFNGQGNMPGPPSGYFGGYAVSG